MKFQLLVVPAIIVASFSCRKEQPQETSFTSFPFYSSTLTLSQKDDKCGEWGGDKRTLVFYRENHDGLLLANYIITQMDCEHPAVSDEKQNKVFSGKTVDKASEQLIIEAIGQLQNKVVHNPKIISNAGISNIAFMIDSSLILKDYPSGGWPKFDLLVQNLKTTEP